MNTRSEVSILRLYMLRAMYAFMAIGLSIYKLPAIFNPPANLSTMGSVVLSVLAGLALLAGVGIHRPLKMLPLLLFLFSQTAGQLDMHVISLIQSANLGELQPYIGILIKTAGGYGPNHFRLNKSISP